MSRDQREINGNATANETRPEIPANNNNEVDFGFLNGELLFFRRTLRFLSLWHPTDAWLVEKLLYPLLVNILLLLLIVVDLYILVNGNWTSLDIYVYMLIDIGMYSSHVFGIFYFRSRDVERNMLNVGFNHGDEVNEFRKKLRRLKLLVSFTYSTLAVLILLFFNIKAWRRGPFQCKSVFTFLKGAPNHIICFLNYPANVYGIGNSLAISWTICLLQQTCFVRLKQLTRNYLTWQGNTEAAIYDHIENYSRKVKKSCTKLELWFFIHNVILMIATPFLISDIIKAFKNIRQNDPSHSGLFLGFLVYTLVVWMSPLYFAEQLQVHDENLCIAVNEFCLGTFQECEPELYAELINSPNENQVTYIFHSRGEVNKFLSYLTHRKSGFLIGSYSFQLKLSMVSIILAMIAFATRIIG